MTFKLINDPNKVKKKIILELPTFGR